MASVGDLFSGLGFGAGGGFIDIVIIILVGSTVLSVLGFGLWFWIKKKKNYNISVEVKIPRNIKQVTEEDGSTRVYGTLNKEWARGYYDAKKGVVFIKRPKKKPVPMKPFDIKRFLSNSNILTVLQIGIEDYRPIVDDSYIEVVDEETGEEAALIKARIDTSESKSWKNAFEREAKMTYSIKNWIAEHGGLVAMGLVLMMNLIGFAVVISRLPK